MTATSEISGLRHDRTLLAARGINAYYGRAQILCDLSLDLGEGEVVVLLGRNGAGKSTTLKSLMGLVRIAGGEIEFRGERIDRLEPYQIAQLGLGYVPEERRIFTDLSVLENLEVGRRAARGGLPAWTSERVFRLFPNLAAIRDRPGGRLSGGEQQMLTIARTLMGNPACILLDEPSEGLAPVVVDRMAAAILELKKNGLSLLLSEQNLQFAKAVADRAYIVEKGRVRFSGSMAELDANGEVRAAYLAL